MIFLTNYITKITSFVSNQNGRKTSKLIHAKTAMPTKTKGFAKAKPFVIKLQPIHELSS
ncbi:hypothetical protein [Anaerobiospirillum succiniciproducens]|uniref:hypothetical protein n=1 Tax=Anaerobiospirillum succiniciproducens TaxID=13335 RepID=UPI003F89387F